MRLLSNSLHYPCSLVRLWSSILNVQCLPSPLVKLNLLHLSLMNRKGSSLSNKRERNKPLFYSAYAGQTHRISLELQSLGFAIPWIEVHLITGGLEGEGQREHLIVASGSEIRDWFFGLSLMKRGIHNQHRWLEGMDNGDSQTITQEEQRVLISIKNKILLRPGAWNTTWVFPSSPVYPPIRICFQKSRAPQKEVVLFMKSLHSSTFFLRELL